MVSIVNQGLGRQDNKTPLRCKLKEPKQYLGVSSSCAHMLGEGIGTGIAMMALCLQSDPPALG